MQSLSLSPVVVNARFLTQPITGVQRFAVEICLRLKELLPKTIFLAPANVLHTDLATQLGVTKLGRLTGHLWEQIELPLYLSKCGYPLLLNLCNTAPLIYKRKIVCIHDLAFLINPSWFSPTFATFYRFLIPKVARSSQKLLTVSEFSKSTITELLGIPTHNIEVIYNAVSESTFSSNEFGENKYGRYVLAVGSLDPRKNLRTLIKAFIRLQEPSLKLVIAGASSKIFKDEAFEKLIGNNPSVVFTGYLTDKELRTAYKHAKLFIYPSLFEGFGLPPLEAMCCGCATIVSHSSSLPEVCGDASFYIDPLDEQGIAEGIRRLLHCEEERLTLIEAGNKQCKMFNWDSSSQKLAHLLETGSL